MQDGSLSRKSFNLSRNGDHAIRHSMLKLHRRDALQFALYMDILYYLYLVIYVKPSLWYLSFQKFVNTYFKIKKSQYFYKSAFTYAARFFCSDGEVLIKSL